MKGWVGLVLVLFVSIIYLIEVYLLSSYFFESYTDDVSECICFCLSLRLVCGDTVLVVLTMYIILAIWKRLPGDIFVLIWKDHF